MDVITEPPESMVLSKDEHYELWYRYKNGSGTGQWDGSHYSLDQARTTAAQKNTELGEGRSYDVIVALVSNTAEEV